ncbi:DUF3298 and DUF4163 domain-containing protein [Microaerobacter geothermalis]|uniref:DUF3298 and DUF4163 domain-containing protein n=1 Tax=Microaerobacter geothermalis TaxID=674972 RepID=UPI001F2353D6|nr:DUF3298 and DUF4163 domain-containing protein [Microaerobacter geothermalis]MCF6093791.1 DUF3298 and DUF4163 domain-containing protein [Microaerobacter geothermalis]
MDPYRLPVPIHTVMITSPGVSIYYPQVIWPSNPMVQDRINHAIYQKVYRMFDSINQQGYFQPGKTELTGNYEVKNNQRGIVSLTLSNFAYTYPMAHPVDNLTSLTTDLRTGKIYKLKDLFKPGSPYVERISENIRVQIKRRDIPVFEEFKSIRPDQDYYIADKCLVIFFQRYEIAPRPAGYPMFPISIYDLQDMIKEDGPLGIMIGD